MSSENLALNSLRYNREVFGEAVELNTNNLPTNGDILRYFFLLFDQFVEEKQRISFKDITPYVVDKVIEIWQQLPIPIIQRKSIHNKINRFLNQYREATRKTKLPDICLDFICSLKIVFSVAKCSCNLLIRNCICGHTPLFMKSFMIDQQIERRHTISGFLETLPQPSLFTITTTKSDASDQTWQRPFSTDGGSLICDAQEDNSTRGSYIQKLHLSNFAMECDRYGVSNRAAASLASALMKDLNIKDKNNQMLVIDKNKVQRERNRARNDVLRKRIDSSTVMAFSFDSRKDDTLVSETINNKRRIRKMKESHMVVVREPDSRLLGHIVLEGEKSETKACQLISFFETNDISLDNLVAICSDGEPVNTGIKGGVIRLFEQHLKRPLHWSICLLHFNELPFVICMIPWKKA